MARGKPKLSVRYSPTAVRHLRAIWVYNANEYGLKRADSYLRFLESGILALSRNHSNGRPIENSPELRSVLLQKRSGSDGHVVVFEVNLVAGEVHILHVFHTKQDWQNKL